MGAPGASGASGSKNSAQKQLEQSQADNARLRAENEKQLEQIYGYKQGFDPALAGSSTLYSDSTNLADSLPKKADVSVTMSRLAPYQEEMQKDIFRSARALADHPVMTPEQQVAGFDPLQQAAITAGQEQILGVRDPETGQLISEGTGIGGYQSFLQEAQAGTRAATGQALRAEGMYDPAATQQFMDPFQQEVIDASMRDISRAGEMERQKLSDAAVGAGAFGGSRDALLQAEQYRGQMKQMADTSAQLRSAGYNQAAQMGMGAFEAARGRDLGIAGLFGQTAGQTASLGTQAQAQAGQDLATLQGLGGMSQAQQQATFDAQRATELERLYEPYKRVGFMADIMGGTPSTQSSMTATPQQPAAPGPSSASQYIGLGMAGLGALGQMGYRPFGSSSTKQ
jgi:hypothetical protein